MLRIIRWVAWGAVGVVGFLLLATTGGWLVTDGPLALSPCVSVMAYRKCDDCFEESVCAIRKALLAARDATAEILESRNLAAAAQQLRRSGAL